MKINFEDMAPTFAAEGVDMRTSRIEKDIVLTRYKCAKGTDFSGAVQGLPHNACPCEHWGYVVSGHMNITTHDGQTFELKAGDAFHLLPGHMPHLQLIPNSSIIHPGIKSNCCWRIWGLNCPNDTVGKCPVLP